ncbi:hypothetical protein NDU88_004517 [Pleurodeles waltl]|uniref:Uncharacterized protein n=1 Tax=Pleurodeles waltl TaxID=8319 RepID=A0AAV7PHS5_PLEWA|nr:hypothetical protein NDU88_004517 [Pleurodeles waltl]
MKRLRGSCWSSLKGGARQGGTERFHPGAAWSDRSGSPWIGALASSSRDLDPFRKNRGRPGDVGDLRLLVAPGYNSCH